MWVDPANAQKAEQDRKTNHAMLVVEKEEEIASLTVDVTEHFPPMKSVPMAKLCKVFSVCAEALPQ